MCNELTIIVGRNRKIPFVLCQINSTTANSFINSFKSNSIKEKVNFNDAASIRPVMYVQGRMLKAVETHVIIQILIRVKILQPTSEAVVVRE